MWPIFFPRKWVVIALAWAAALALADEALAQARAKSPSGPSAVVLLETNGVVEILRAGRKLRAPLREPLQPGDQVQTRFNSRAAGTWFDQGPFQFGQNTDIVIPPPPGQKERSLLRMLKGRLYFFHRDEPGKFELQSPAAHAAIGGTEFTVEVDADSGRTTINLFDGEVELRAAGESIQLRSRERGVVEPGKPPEKSPMLEAPNDLIQWFLYYPAVLDVEELGWGEGAPEPLRGSVAAYREGDLLRALAEWPDAREPSSDAERVYLAALLLAVGQPDKCETLLAAVGRNADRTERVREFATALRTLIAAVKFQPRPAAAESAPAARTASQWLAESYFLQASGQLEAALRAATNAVQRSPRFGFAWARVAELEFSFARKRPMRAALDHALTLAPRHAQARALQGFLFSAENRISEAIASFDEAIGVDGGLANAWLGRGLCRIRRGDTEGGLGDLQVAAALEPQRALLRSYLGKAFSLAGRTELALKEIQLAKQLDPNDPTGWFYSALLNAESHRVNPGVRDLEHAQELSGHRRLDRSEPLLDQDRAVRGANQANIFFDAGLTDVSAREAVRAVNTDYANYSAHLFLANSYDRLRDPRQINLRYETPWLSEFLTANLLAPVGAGTLSPTVSQQEYSKLFERDRFGLVSSTEYFSSGQWFQSAAQHGVFGNTGYSIDASYRSENGLYPNTDFEEVSVSLRLKQQLTAADSVFFQGAYGRIDAGDVRPYYDPSRAQTRFRAHETQEPLLLAGYHHEWSPWSHTLFLAGRLQDSVRVTNADQGVLLLFKFRNNITALPYPGLPTTALDYQSDLEIYTGEWQQILRAGDHSLVAGARAQGGAFDTRSRLAGGSGNIGFANARATNYSVQVVEPVSRDVSADFLRTSLYVYDNWRVADPLLLCAGLTYDRLHFPVNFRSVPNSALEETTEKLLPKIGLIWTPLKRTTLRAAYARALGGVSFDQSFQLEPTQIAGFNQAFRSLMPETAAGSVAGERLELYGLSLEQQIGTDTYLGAQADELSSVADRRAGAIVNGRFAGRFDGPTSTPEHLRYRERNLTLTVNQLAGRDWSFGARYRLSDANLRRALVEISPVLVPASRSDVSATLHQLNLFVRFNHPSGFFAETDAVWSMQSNRGYSPPLPGDEFWQFSVHAGYRFPRRRAEVRVGVLNLTDRDYRLNPLNLTAELPRERTFTASFKFHF